MSNQLDRISHRGPWSEGRQGVRRGGDARISCGVNQGSEVTDAEREFLVAVDEYKRTQNRPFPALRELLGILLGLGYRRP